MNMQALMQQAKKMQRDMEKAKSEVEAMTFTAKSALVEAEVNGKKELTKLTILDKENIEKDDLDMLEDMILVAVNEALKKAEDTMNDKMGKMAPNIPGLF